MTFLTADAWGPDGRRAALSVTFDNLGEGRDVGAGTWPEGRLFGAHSSAVRALPRILGALRDLDVTASFFVEGWNLDVYTSQLEDVVDAGHDLGLHGWVHAEQGLGVPSTPSSSSGDTRRSRSIPSSPRGPSPPRPGRPDR